MADLPSFFPTSLKPTEAVTWFNLALVGFIGGIGVMVLSEKIKEKSYIPMKDLVIWGAAVPAIVTAASIYFISKSSK